jgi:hypothetical protein
MIMPRVAAFDKEGIHGQKDLIRPLDHEFLGTREMYNLTVSSLSSPSRNAQQSSSHITVKSAASRSPRIENSFSTTCDNGYGVCSAIIV